MQDNANRSSLTKLHWGILGVLVLALLVRGAMVVYKARQLAPDS